MLRLKTFMAAEITSHYSLKKVKLEYRPGFTKKIWDHYPHHYCISEDTVNTITLQ